MLKVGCFIIVFPVVGLIIFYLTSFIGMLLIGMFSSQGIADGLVILPFTALFSVVMSLFITITLLKDAKTDSSPEDQA